MKCVCEFQAFYNNDNEFVIKELVVIDIQNRGYTHLHFLPPFERTKLNGIKRRTATWLENHFHGLLWEEGNVKYNLNTIRSVLNQYSTIYTKGAEKQKFLKSIVDVKVYDLDIFKSLIPKLPIRQDEKYKIVCPIETGLHCVYGSMRCALYKAVHLANWLIRSVLYCEYRREYDRLNSFYDDAERSSDHVKDIVKSGFYAHTDTICCVWCGKSYTSVCDVVEEHSKNSPFCDSLIGFVNNVPIALEHIVPRDKRLI